MLCSLFRFQLVECVGPSPLFILENKFSGTFDFILPQTQRTANILETFSRTFSTFLFFFVPHIRSICSLCLCFKHEHMHVLVQCLYTIFVQLLLLRECSTHFYHTTEQTNKCTNEQIYSCSKFDYTFGRMMT